MYYLKNFSIIVNYDFIRTVILILNFRKKKKKKKIRFIKYFLKKIIFNINL